MPLVSFIIPYYNLPLDLIRRCVESVAAVSLDSGEREIIVVDDGSKEDVSKQLRDVCPDLIYIRRTNGGLSAARNTGIEAATGEYIQFVDGDDRLIPNVYDKCVDKLRETRADMLMFRHTEDERAVVEKKPYVGLFSGTDFMMDHNLRASACGYVFRKALIGDDIRFTAGIYHEDEDFTPRVVINAEKLIYTDATAYFYTLRNGSITTKKDDGHILKRLDDKRDIIFGLWELCSRLYFYDYMAMERRVRQLTMDYIFNIITSRRGWQELRSRLSELKGRGLFPLPIKRYTLKYYIFASLADTYPGLLLLSAVLRMVKRNR